MEQINNTLKRVQELVKEFPNDKELGSEIRKLVNETPINYLEQIKRENEKARVKKEKARVKRERDFILNKPFIELTKEGCLSVGFESDVYDIGSAFYQLISYNLDNINASKLNIERAKCKAWLNPIKLLIQTDGATTEQLRDVFKFLKGHSFWSANIQSTEKLRRQFATLHAQAKQEIKTDKNGKEENGISQDYLQRIANGL